MIKLSALNEESEEDSDSEEEVTREALEQIALQQYAKALDLQRKGNLSEAMQLLNDLLETELLFDVKKPAPGKSTDPLFNLKYLCFKNVASMQNCLGEMEKAIESYSAAADLDDTDVTLWYKLGLTCIKAKDFEKALYSFQRGTDCNSRHWPCIDKIVLLQMGLNYYNDCISTIYEALLLDPGYLRGLVYRRHIYTNYPYIRDFLIHLDPKYKSNDYDEVDIDKAKAEELLKEADKINIIYIDQLNSEKFKYTLPQLPLKQAISDLSWQAVGESLINMHHFMTENAFSHACIIKLDFKISIKEEVTQVCNEQKLNENQNKTIEAMDIKSDENVLESDKNMETGSDDNNELSDKATTDTEKVESDVDIVVVDAPIDSALPPISEIKETKKTPVRRRGSALSFLGTQWEWCMPRKSGRKKTNCKQDRDDENIYETLRRMIPLWLLQESETKKTEPTLKSPDVMDLHKLFEEKPGAEDTNINYFGSDGEQKDVKDFIEKYTINKCDIIELLKDYLHILSKKWQVKWPDGLSQQFIEANKCYSNHIDIPSCNEDNYEEIVHYTFVNILCEEFQVNSKLNLKPEGKQYYNLNIIESIGMILNNKPDIYGSDCFELTLRYFWVKLHIHILNKCEELALECLYQLLYEFETMGEHHDSYTLEVINFTFKPLIKELEINNYIKFLERNKKLSTVLELYEKFDYEEVLSIIIDSFEYSKNMAREQEEELSLDFAVQLSLILDCYWALEKVDDCFKWSLTCLHESIKHYFQSNSGTPERSKWSLIIVKVLYCIEHILSTEGLSCLELLTQKELSNIIEDLIRIIGHQVDTNVPEMPFGTVVPWIIMYYILQREDDQGRSRRLDDKETVASDEIPIPIMVLFIAHEQLGNHGWCCANDGKLLYFILDTIIPRLRSPSLSKSLEQVCQYMEQCVYCLFGHPGKKTKLRYLVDHKVTPHSLDWNRAQQIYEIFKPSSLPEVEGKIPSISAETEQLFHRILAILPSEYEPHKYVPDMEKYLNGKIDKIPVVPPLLPYKMKDIYFLLGDYYFKKEERKRSIKFNMFDIIINNDRFGSWAEIALAKAVNLELKLNSCCNLDNKKDYLNPAYVIIRCFKRALDLDTMHCNLWIEYGAFVYSVYSFCSRLLKHASESLNMNDFELLEKQKENMLETTQLCFTNVIQDRLNNSTDDKVNDEMWLHYYMMGKIAEKQNKSPSVYLDYYMKAVKSLEEADAVYPLKINYNTPQHLSFEVLELHYRIHASILKYIEQHENKPIPVSIGKIFLNCIEEWKNGPFAKNTKSDNDTDFDAKDVQVTPQAGNILKRSISDAGEEDNQETKRLKLESAAAKVRRSASYDTERVINKDGSSTIGEEIGQTTVMQTIELKQNEDEIKVNGQSNDNKSENPVITTNSEMKSNENDENQEKCQPAQPVKNVETSSSSSTTSTTDSSSEDTTTDSSSESSGDTNKSNKSNNIPMTDENYHKLLTTVLSACLDALEDCSSRFSQHYKALYRLAHYHFYYKKGRDIERARDIMLSNYISRSNQKLNGLFCERKQTNFFNGVWRIPSGEVDRPGGFSCHMNRCVLLTMEILKEIDDHKTLLDLSLHLQRVPDPDKKYLRDADREDLAQQAFSLSVQSLKGQLIKFSQQADLKSNEIERQALNSLMLDIYNAYLRTQKHQNSKQFINLLCDGYKLVTTVPVNENTNLTDISLKYCQSLKAALKQKATLASLDKSSQNAQKKQVMKTAAVSQPIVVSTAPTTSSILTIPTTTASEANPKNVYTAQPKHDKAGKSLPNNISTPLANYLPLVSQQTTAALLLSYYKNIGAFDNYSLQNPLQSQLHNTLPNSFQSEFYRRFFPSNLPSYNLPATKKTSKPKQILKQSVPLNTQIKAAKQFNKTTHSSQVSYNKNVTNISSSSSVSQVSAITPTVSSAYKSSVQPAHMTSQSTHSTSSQPAHAHLSVSSTVNAALQAKPPLPHQQVSPGKTLQEKLAERQKHHPSIKTSIQESLNKLPSSLTVTKTAVNKKTEVKKSLSFNDKERLTPTVTDEVIVLDDD